MLVRFGQEVQALPRRLTGEPASRRPASRRAAAVLGGLVGLVLLAGCGSASRRTTCPTCAATVAQVRIDTLAGVAARIYNQEVFGPANGAAFATIAPLPRLVRGLETGDYGLARAALLEQPVRHAVRARVVRGGRVLVDVGVDFVIAGQPRRLGGPGGRRLGRMEVSIQDVIGFVRLVQRLTGTELVVRGSLAQHAQASLPAALQIRLPGRGSVAIDGRRYLVSSFQRPGFAGEQLTVWVLAPTH